MSMLPCKLPRNFGLKFLGLLRRLIRVRYQQWKKAKRTKDEQAWIEYRMVRNYVTTQLRKSKQEYLKSIVCQSRQKRKM